jgi:hypothetical protein
MNPQRIGALTGVLFVILAIVAFAVGGETPDTNDSAQKIVTFYVDNDSEQVVASIVLAWASVALLFFVGTLRQHLRSVAGRDSTLSTAVVLGGLMIAVGATIFAGLTFALGDAADDMPPAAVVALNTLNSDLFFPLGVGVAVFNLGLGLAVVRHGGFPRPLGYVAVVVGIAALTPGGFFAFLATGLVILYTSIALAVRAHGPSTAGFGAPASG